MSCRSGLPESCCYYWQSGWCKPVVKQLLIWFLTKKKENSNICLVFAGIRNCQSFSYKTIVFIKQIVVFVKCDSRIKVKVWGKTGIQGKKIYLFFFVSWSICFIFKKIKKILERVKKLEKINLSHPVYKWKPKIRYLYITVSQNVYKLVLQKHFSKVSCH